MKNKAIKVTKGYIKTCECCNDVRELVQEAEKNYKADYHEKYPDTGRNDYDIEDDVKGVVGYSITNPGSYGNTYICEQCMDAMSKATKVLQANGCEEVQMATSTDKFKYNMVIESNYSKEQA